MTRTIFAGAFFAALALTSVAVAIPAASVQSRVDDGAGGEDRIALTTLALRVHRISEMEHFYAEAFDVAFRGVTTGPFRSRFGELGGITLKLVPIRDGVDFDGYPVHQPGITVPDVERVIRLAEAHGGRREGEPVREGDVVVRASVRDPDGNTIELYRAEGS